MKSPGMIGALRLVVSLRISQVLTKHGCGDDFYMLDCNQLACRNPSPLAISEWSSASPMDIQDEECYKEQTHADIPILELLPLKLGINGEEYQAAMLSEDNIILVAGVSLRVQNQSFHLC